MPRNFLYLAILLLAALSACSATPSTPPFSAMVVRLGPGSPRPTLIYLTDAAQIARLESFFPNCRTRPRSNTAAGWIAGYEVYFNFAYGQTIRVTVSENGNAEFWTAGQGDFRTHGDFPAFLASLPP